VTKFLAFLIAVAAGAAALFLVPDRSVEIRLSEADLLRAVSRKLPFERTYLHVLDVRLDSPRISLVEGSNRIKVGLDAAVEAKLGDKPPLNGSADASGAVRYDPSDGAFYIVDPEIESLAVDGLPPTFADRIDTALTKAFKTFFKTRPIYRLKESDTKQAAARLALKDVAVESGDLVLTLGL
jgi:hypothetical protein